ncbi:hypothetical protein P872_01690 [Rhodonellum psychrophilum GCM71 = DSM 17998]|uniref:Uncharacterized protein n=1 Tax=Rhodonellum psychrophilum GCM71 = DSM 17998 TaxID=1123057 RepID=U5C501_9BACT|nr:hypothetical protein P872_01690 [Rhodonellum psychrophilum GCM71 = DSM 17998]
MARVTPEIFVSNPIKPIRKDCIGETGIYNHLSDSLDLEKLMLFFDRLLSKFCIFKASNLTRLPITSDFWCIKHEKIRNYTRLAKNFVAKGLSQSIDNSSEQVAERKFYTGFK